jgi:hypothetical protein
MLLPVLSVFGQLETFIADELYPYRYVITPVVLLAVVLAFAVAGRIGVHRLLWRHRLASVAAGAPLLIIAILAGNYLASPLWERSYLNEARPAEAAGTALDAPSGLVASGSAGEPAAAADAAVRLAGKFTGADDFHFGRGDALIIRGADGANVLRFENFSVRNGPDLFVYLSRDASGRRVEEALNLGKLKATDGAFNYVIPSAVKLDEIKSVVVWCRQFSVLFSVAELQRI